MLISHVVPDSSDCHHNYESHFWFFWTWAQKCAKVKLMGTAIYKADSIGACSHTMMRTWERGHPGRCGSMQASWFKLPG